MRYWHPLTEETAAAVMLSSPTRSSFVSLSAVLDDYDGLVAEEVE